MKQLTVTTQQKKRDELTDQPTDIRSLLQKIDLKVLELMKSCSWFKPAFFHTSTNSPSLSSALKKILHLIKVMFFSGSV